MAAWLTYCKERFPLVVYALLVGGLTVSGYLLSQAPWSLKAFLLSFFGLFVFFFELRLMDEYKDFKKDLIANPDRPLPRGLIPVGHVRKAIYLGLVLMLVNSQVIFLELGAASGLSYGAVTIYLFFMFKEFFISSWLEKRMLIYAISHQVILIGLCAFSYFTFAQEFSTPVELWAYSLAVLGSFFSYEVCRKLDPDADPILGTYLVVYGLRRSVAILVGTTSVAVVGAYLLGPAAMVLIPMSLSVLGATAILFTMPEKFKIVEGVATISLLFHLWCGGVVHLFRSYL